MLARLPSVTAARLLVVLYVTAGCAAAQQQQPSAEFSTTPDELSCFIEQTVWAKLQPLISKLESRLDTLDRRLDHVEGEGGPGGSEPLPRDCSDLPAGAQSGIHILQPGLDRSLPPVSAYCVLGTDGGKWTVIQRRDSLQPHQNFNLGWAAYKEGFGELDAEFWWGLDNMWTMTAQRDRRYELRITLEDFDGEKAHAVYQRFRISSEEDGYRLSASSYTGDAGDSLLVYVNSQFSTLDRDQDGWVGHCAQHAQGAWWYGNGCGHSNLNGLSQGSLTNIWEGIVWSSWKGLNSLKKTEMKIRRV